MFWTSKVGSFVMVDGCSPCSALTGLISKSNACCLRATSGPSLIARVAVWDVVFGFVRHSLRIEGQVSPACWWKCERLSERSEKHVLPALSQNKMPEFIKR